MSVREALLDTSAFSLGGQEKWCMVGRHRKDGLVKVRIAGLGYVGCKPEEIIDVRDVFMTREEVAGRLGISLSGLAQILHAQKEGPQYWRCGWTKGYVRLRRQRLEEWVAMVAPLIEATPRSYAGLVGISRVRARRPTLTKWNPRGASAPATSRQP